MYILIVVLIGWIVGMCAELLLPGTAPRSFVGDHAGGRGRRDPGDRSVRAISSVGGIAAKLTFEASILSLLGAILLLALWRLFRRRKSST